MASNSDDRFDILRQLAVAGYRGEDFRPTAEMALRQAADIVGLSAAAMYLWDDKMTVSLAVAYAESDPARQTLASLEDTLFAGLRRERQLLAAYMSFAGNPPLQTFTMPIRHRDKI